ncbi:hypothetical protein LTR62_005209 [Meristemomyces frigidus]|uniref:Uncharacterized protein n=1 Tax=Meristemomyces frigidus TaxID=1508187 RepID=A0AAN7YNS5_9PEZI|nr:hypothetical protein LTR62_005209 [Meristemomyces frigidus]
MSIIPRTNPLNLQFRICIVTSASSPQGIVICKTLLKANGFVLGVDEGEKDPSLNAGRGTHFQFLRCRVREEGVGERVLEALREGFEGRERADVLVCLDGGIEGRRLRRAVAGLMARQGTGAIVDVIDLEHEESRAGGLQGSAGYHLLRNAMVAEPGGWRYNLASAEVSLREKRGGFVQPLPRYTEALEHMRPLIKTEE